MKQLGEVSQSHMESHSLFLHDLPSNVTQTNPDTLLYLQIVKACIQVHLPVIACDWDLHGQTCDPFQTCDSIILEHGSVRLHVVLLLCTGQLSLHADIRV